MCSRVAFLADSIWLAHLLKISKVENRSAKTVWYHLKTFLSDFLKTDLLHRSSHKVTDLTAALQPDILFSSWLITRFSINQERTETL